MVFSYSLLFLALTPSFTSGQAWILCGGDEYCHPTRGACVEQSDGDFACECLGGWDGDNCNEDRDECVEDQPCPDNAFCVNTSPGSDPYPQYKCDCLPGFTAIRFDEHGATRCSNDPQAIILEAPPEGTEEECVASCPWQRGQCVQNDSGRYICACDDGYRYDTQANDCVDRNECLEDYPCPPEAEGGFCVDYDPDHPEFQKYKCGCVLGYSETGTDEHGATGCEPDAVPTEAPTLDPCDNNTCCDDETCVAVDEGTGYECQCNNLSGLCCVENIDVEDCGGQCNPDNQECGPNNICICKSGYFSPSGAGGVCFPEAECDDPSRNNCDRNALCIEENPGFQCECRDGYEGDGTEGNCNDINECDDGPCSSDEICINTNGSFRCELRTPAPTSSPVGLAIFSSPSASPSARPSASPSASPSARHVYDDDDDDDDDDDGSIVIIGDDDDDDDDGSVVIISGDDDDDDDGGININGDDDDDDDDDDGGSIIVLDDDDDDDDNGSPVASPVAPVAPVSPVSPISPVFSPVFSPVGP